MVYIILIIIIILLYYKYNKIKIVFLSSNVLYDKLYHILHDYYYYMSKENLKLRGINNLDLHLKNIKNLFYTCSYYEKEIIKKAVYKAEKKLNNLNYTGFYPKKLKNVPWIFGFSDSDKYEFGLPHTQGNVIILNRNNIYLSKLVTLLIHERIHIYQKLYPADIEEFVRYYNFQKISKKTNVDRVNPDTDNFIYKRFNEIYECKILPSNQTIYTKNNSMYEHPYEYMAYMISENA